MTATGTRNDEPWSISKFNRRQCRKSHSPRIHIRGRGHTKDGLITMGDGRAFSEKDSPLTKDNEANQAAERLRESLRDPFQVGDGAKLERTDNAKPVDAQAADKAAADKAAADKAAADKAAAEKAAADKAAADKAAAEKAAADKQAGQPATDKPADKPVSDKPAESKLEAIKPWEQLTEREQANFRILQASATKLLPYMKADVLVGETEQKLQADVTGILNKEKDPERRKSLQSLLENKEGVDRKKVLGELLKSEKDPENKKVLQGLIDGEKTRDSRSELLKKVEAGDYAATMEFYPIAVKYLQKNVTQTVVDLANMQIGDNQDPAAFNRFPEGCPIKLPTKDGFPAIYEYYLAQVKEGKVPMDLSEDPKDLLSDTKRLAGLTNATNWFMTGEETVVRAQRQFDADMLHKRLKEDFKVPAGWDMPQAGDVRALDSWYAAAIEMNNLMNRTRNYAQAYKSLSGITPEFRDQAIKELRELGAVIEFEPNTDKLVKCELPMPKDLRLDLPENKEKIQKLEAWLEKWHKPVDEAIEAYKKGYGSFLRYGDFTGPADKGTVVYDKQGKVNRILDVEGNPTTIYLRDGKQEEVIHRNGDGKFIDKVGREITPDTSNDGKQEKFDYTNHSFSTKRLPNGDVEITMSRSFEKDNVVNYNYWFGTQVSTLEEKRVVKPNEYIGVVSNVTGRYELLRADDLEGWTGWRAKQMALHHGGKVATVVMDVGLTVVGAPEAAVAFRAGRIGVGALQATRALIGVTGFLTPALRTGAFDGALKHVGLDGNDIIKARHIAIMGDVFAIGLGGGALRVFTGAKEAAHTASMLQRVAHVGMAGTSFVYGPMIYQSIDHKLDHNAGRTEEQRTRRADGERGISEGDFKKFAFDFQNPEVRKATGDMLESYRTTLATGIKDQATQEKVDKIFARTKEILALPENHPDRKAFVKEMMAYHLPSGKELLLQRMNEKSGDYTRELESGDKTAAANKKLMQDMETELQGKKLSDKSEQEKIAATMAMLLLSTNKDGGLPKEGTLASRTETLPAHDKIVTKQAGRAGTRSEWSDIKARSVEQTFTVNDAMKYLEKQVATSPDHAGRLAVADQLFRLGKLDSRQLAAVCADIVEKKDAPEALRVKAIYDANGPRLGVLLNELQHEEEQMRGKSQAEQMAFLGHINGVSTADLTKSLLSVAGSDGQNGKALEPADLRAACAMAVIANRQNEVGERQRILQDATTKYSELSGKPGAFAGHVVDVLKTNLNAEIKDGDAKTGDRVREERLQAAVLLRTLGKINAGDKEFQLSTDDYNKRLLECITQPGQNGAAGAVFVSDKRPDITHEVLRSLDLEKMSVPDRTAVLQLLTVPLNNAATNRDVEAAKMIVLSRLPELLKGTDPSVQPLRDQARAQLHEMLTPGSAQFTGQFGSLRLSAVKALHDIGYSDAKTIDLLKRRLAYDTDKKEFNERSPQVRRAALEALYKINPDDAGEIGMLHRTLERDPSVGRRSRSMEQEMILRKGLDPRNLNDNAQETSAKLTEPYKASSRDGKQFLEGSQFKLIRESDLDAALVAAHKSVYDETVELNANKGTTGAGFSLAKGWDRISSFSMSEADRQVGNATSKVWAQYVPMSLDLGRLAQDEHNKDAPRAINAVAYFLSNNCEEVWERHRETVMNNMAIAMMDLCKPNKNREQVATHIENLLTGHHEMSAQAQLYLLQGLKRLVNDGAIDKPRAAKICAKALDQVTRAQNFRRPTDTDQKQHEQLQKELVQELVRYRVRDLDVLGYLKGAAENHPYKSVKEAAGLAYGDLTEGVNLIWQEVHAAPDGGTPAAERADMLNAAIADPSIKDDKLIRLILKTSEGLPISDINDPRVAALKNIAETTTDPRIKEAVAVALMPNTTGDYNLFVTLFSYLAEVEKTGKPAQVREAKAYLESTAKKNASWAKLIEDARKRAADKAAAAAAAPQK